MRKGGMFWQCTPVCNFNELPLSLLPDDPPLLFLIKASQSMYSVVILNNRDSIRASWTVAFNWNPLLWFIQIGMLIKLDLYEFVSA